jgi:hypothetical protein
MKTISLMAILILLSPYSIFAQGCSTSENKLAIYFSSGMSNDYEDAIDSLQALKRKTQSQLTNMNYTVYYDIAYNQNEQWYYQLAEVFAQRKIEEWSLFWKYLSNINIAPDWFKNKMKS